MNKLRCHALFKFSANRITWSRLLIEIHILNGKQYRSRSVGFWEANWSGSSLFAKAVYIQVQHIYPGSIKLTRRHCIKIFCEDTKNCDLRFQSSLILIFYNCTLIWRMFYSLKCFSQNIRCTKIIVEKKIHCKLCKHSCKISNDLVVIQGSYLPVLFRYSHRMHSIAN